MAKKKSSKKHRFKYGQAATPAMPSPSQTTADGSHSSSQAAPVLAKPTVSSSPDFSYVRRDLSKLTVLATAFIAAELLLWYAFNHTGLGAAVYRLIRVS